MPVQTRAAKRAANERTSFQACGVCYETIRPSNIVRASGVVRPRNGLQCSNYHTTCFDCVAKMCGPTMCDGSSCTGLAFKCPLCRDVSCIQRLEMLCMLKKDSNKLFENFVCSNHMTSWGHP